MGRKPNALIIKHFDRGAKLNDSSNRYEHTCKSCGERFPKGRIDSLTTHLTKRCNAISHLDRQAAIHDIENGDGPRRHVDMQMQGAVPDVPMASSNNGTNWPPLNALAEVSRQQLVLNRNHIDVPQTNPPAGSISPAEAPQTRPHAHPQPHHHPITVHGHLELQEQYTLDNPPVSYEQRVQREKKAQSMKNVVRPVDHASALPNFHQMPDSRYSSPNLAMAAAAAAHAQFVPSMVDPQLLDEDAQASHDADAKLEQDLQNATSAGMAGDDFFEGPTQEQHSTWPMLDGSGGNMYQAAPSTAPSQMEQVQHIEQEMEQMDHSSAPSGNFPRIAMHNQAMTTKFSAEYGNGMKSAKTKSRGRFTPVRRKEVQAVRKLGACIRCRMLKKPCSGGDPCNTCKSVESARLWKHKCIRTRLAEVLDHYSAGLHKVMVHRLVQERKNFVHFRTSHTRIQASHFPLTTIFAVFNSQEATVDITGDSIDPGLNGKPETLTYRMLDNEKEDLPLKLEAYTKRMMPVFIERETSQFMGVTLSTAYSLSLEKHDILLTRVLDLWATVHVMIDSEMNWVLFEEDQAGQGATIDDDLNYKLLCHQLNAAAENKAAQISKSILNDLERRLLQRTTTSSFETFLVAIILLNCVEKSTWLFEHWGIDQYKHQWPLDQPPGFYESQGDKIADVLSVLLRMRNVPPKITITDEGILASDVDVAQSYFENMKLSAAYVVDKQKNFVFEASNSRCYELRFCARLLLPASY